MNSTWSDFLSVLAEGSIALLALLFVSFQITRDRWIKEPMRKLIAVQTLLEFLVPAFFGIVALLPTTPIILKNMEISAWQIGGVFTSLLGIIVAIAVTRFAIKNKAQLTKFGKRQLNLQPMAIGEYLLLFIFSIAGSLVWSSVVLIWLLLSGSWETWEFFTELE